MLVFISLLSRVEIVEGVSDFYATLGIGATYEAGGRAIKFVWEWHESRAGVNEESQIAGMFLGLALGWRVSPSCPHYGRALGRRRLALLSRATMRAVGLTVNRPGA